ncbi:hypothetical protein [Streptacidiphilus sp. MAP5-52]|uniref:hypothetical protein n=1 Tax=Streptacidiphilus sp. MAP5-52 TaxID=3156267 RepID=UPI003516AEEA
MESHEDRRLRQTYTGDSAWYLARTVQSREPGIRAASADQALVEHHFLSELHGGFAWAAHPVSIRATRVLTGRTEVLLDEQAFSGRGGHSYDIAEHAICRLLPTGATDGELGGVRGLRVRRVDDRGLHLQLLHASTGRLVLVGPTRERWHGLLKAHRQLVIDAGCSPLWELPQQGAAEIKFAAEHGSYEASEAGMSWLTSGLLRRIGLWHTASNAYCTRYWQRGDQTMIWELRHLYRARPMHDEFTALLRSPLWGPPLTIWKQHCDCHSRRPDPGGQPHPAYQRQCTFEYHHPDRPGVLQVRFRTMEPQKRDDPGVRAALEAAGADPGWLNRVLPVHVETSDAA